MKNKLIAALLALFTFCGHRFYLGQIGLGFLYLFTLGLLGFGAFIDFIIFLSMSDESFDRKYNKGYSTALKNSPSKIADEIKKLHELKESGIITDTEFAAQKLKLMN